MLSLMASPDKLDELKRESLDIPSLYMTDIQLFDLEMLLNGAMSPLRGFMTEADYRNVCSEMRLSNGLIWPMPITLDVSEDFATRISTGERILLLHPEGMPLAVMTVSDIWQPDNFEEAQTVLGTTDTDHPGVFHLLKRTKPVRLGGLLEGMELPPHYTFRKLRYSPQELRSMFNSKGIESVVAFQTRNPLHRAHVELTMRAAKITNSHLLIHPVVGVTKPGDIDYFVRVRCYKAVLDRYKPNSVTLSLLPLAMRMAGPREAIWHAIIRKNYGCRYFIIGRDHAGPGKSAAGIPYYEPYAARELLSAYAEDIGVVPVPFEEMVYVQETDSYMPRSEVQENTRALSLSGTELRQRLESGEKIPQWFSYPEVVAELSKSYPPRAKRGFTVFFTGLPSAGKSTIAAILASRILEVTSRPVTVLDGDLIRRHLSSELTFSKEHRDLNIQRIGFVASEITRHGGIAICAPIAPYASTRRIVRDIVASLGGFVEVHVDTPIEECKRRDRKGLYVKAMAGIIKNFTGVDDPYESPECPEIRIDTMKMAPHQSAEEIIGYLRKEGYIASEKVK